MIAIPLVGPIVKRTLSDKSVCRGHVDMSTRFECRELTAIRCHQLDVEIADPVRPERADNQLHERR
jgi:hypothetical protein